MGNQEMTAGTITQISSHIQISSPIYSHLQHITQTHSQRDKPVSRLKMETSILIQVIMQDHRKQCAVQS